jgi:hypothetical protein
LPGGALVPLLLSLLPLLLPPEWGVEATKSGLMA